VRAEEPLASSQGFEKRLAHGWLKEVLKSLYRAMECRPAAKQLAEKVPAGAEDPGFVGAPAFRPVK